MRPIVHTFGSFLVERAFEQVKLGFGHQDVGGVLVGSGGSFDVAGRRPHPPGARATSRCSTRCPAGRSTCPGTPTRSTRRCARRSPATAATTCGWSRSRTAEPFPVTPGRFHVVRRGAGATVVAVGPMLDAVLAAVEGLDVTVLYAGTVRPFDARDAARGAARPARGGAGRAVPGRDVAHGGEPTRWSTYPTGCWRSGCGREELRRYGTPAEHLARARPGRRGAARGRSTRSSGAGHRVA